ncbi:MAG: CBS domain-containing protein [Bdellovibrio sp.]|nr:CBS domain-containing protein [Bdellovibrio sp.]
MENLTADIMTKDISTVHWSDTLEFASQKMHRLNIRHLPVVDDQGLLLGLLSERDVQRGRSAHTDFVTPEFNPIVRDYMTAPVEQITSDASLQEVAHRMMAFKISAFVVVENEEIVGIVTSDDLLRALISLLDHTQNPDGFEDDRLSYYSPIGEIANFFSQAGI